MGPFAISMPTRYWPPMYAVLAFFALAIGGLIGVRTDYHDLISTHCRNAQFWPSLSATMGNKLPSKYVWRLAFPFLFVMHSFAAVVIGLRLASGIAETRKGNPAPTQPEGSSSKKTSVLSQFFSCFTGINMLQLYVVFQVLRNIAAFLWSLVNSSESTLVHEAGFALYQVCVVVFQGVLIRFNYQRRHLTGSSPTTPNYRRSYNVKLICVLGEVCSSVALVYYFIDHSSNCTPYAYSKAMLCEWTFSAFNLMFDASGYWDLQFEGDTVISFSGSGGTTLQLGVKPVTTTTESAHETTGESGLSHHVGGDAIKENREEENHHGDEGEYAPRRRHIPTIMTYSLAMATAPSKSLIWAAEVYFAYLAWGSSIQLLQVVYYFPLVAMKFTLESSLVLSPMLLRMLLANAKVWRLLAPSCLGGLDGCAWCYVICVFGMFQYDAGKETGNRIVAMSFIAATLQLAHRTRLLALTAVSSSTSSSPTVEEADDGTPSSTKETKTSSLFASDATNRLVYAQPLGLAVHMVVRLLWASLDMAHASPLFNGLAIPVTCFFALVMWRQAKYSNWSNGVNPDMPSLDSKTPTAIATCPLVRPVLGKKQAMLGGLGIGAMRIISAYFLTNAGTMSRYVGINPFPSGIVLAIVFLVAIWFDSARGGVPLLTPKQLTVGLVASSTVFYYACSASDRMFQKPNSGKPVWYDTPMHQLSIDDWYIEHQWGSPMVAYCGGLVMVFLLGLSMPPFYHMLFRTHSNTKAATEGGSHTFLLELWAAATEWSLFVVGLCATSYPFIPGGFFFRDHLQYLLIPTCALIGFTSVQLSVHSTKVLGDTTHVKRSVLTPITFVLFILAVFGVSGWRHFVETPTIPPMAGAGTIDALPASGETSGNDIQCLNPTALGKNVTFMIWTIHFGLDNYGADSCERLYKLIAKTNSDVIGLLETDLGRPQNGARDVVEYVAYRLGYEYTDFGPTGMDSTFGTAIISRFPIMSLKRYVMPSPVGELAPLIEAVLDIYGTPVMTFVSHFGNTDHNPDRRLQAQFLGQRVAATDLPSVFVGYLTSRVRRNNYHYYVRKEADQLQSKHEAEHLSERMDHQGLFKDTGYQMYRNSQWVFVNARQKMEIEHGHLDEAFALKTIGGQVSGRVRGPPGRDSRDQGDVAIGSEVRIMRQNEQFRDENKRFGFPPPKVGQWVYYPHGNRFGSALPRAVFWSRYCQHILYKPGYESAANEERCVKGRQAGQMYLVDWKKVMEIEELSDTEIQVATFVFATKDPMFSGPAEVKPGDTQRPHLKEGKT